MNTGLLLSKSRVPKDRSLARIISIEFVPAKKIKEKAKPSREDETFLFYTKPIFRAKKYELF